MNDRPKLPHRKLTVTSSTRKAGGTSQKTGREWNLYALGVLNEAGEPVEAEFKSFQDLTTRIGELHDYEVEKQEDEKYGTSYLIKPAGGVARRVEELEKRVAELERLVRNLGPPSGDRGPEELPAQAAGAAGPRGF